MGAATHSESRGLLHLDLAELRSAVPPAFEA